MAKIIDARGLACPQPVILTRKAFSENEPIITIVDNETSQNNVTKMAEKSGYQVTAEKKSDGIYLHLNQTAAVNEVTQTPVPSGGTRGPLVVAISSEFMGHDDNELGLILIRSFLHTLNEVKPLPDTLIFFNSGVKLVVEGSPVLEDLNHLVDLGVEILACGTCLGHFSIKEKIKVGIISNMYTIAETLLNAGKLVNI
jgi:selenium metabolism protein YedF